MRDRTGPETEHQYLTFSHDSSGICPWQIPLLSWKKVDCLWVITIQTSILSRVHNQLTITFSAGNISIGDTCPCYR